MDKLLRHLICFSFRLYTLLVFRVNGVTAGHGCIVKGKMYIRNRGRIVIGDNFRANSGKRFNPIGGDTVVRFITDETATITIGNHCGISNSTICCRSSVTIEDNVQIGGSCKIYDSDFHPMDYDERVEMFRSGNEQCNIKTLPVVIKSGAWIGGHCIILKGVAIGERSVVGAGSVVTRNIPCNEVWAGNPARFIRRIG